MPSMRETAGQRIKRAREAAGLNKSELAVILGVSPSTLSEVESGETKLPSLEVAYNMCQALGITIRWILYGEEGEILTPTDEEAELLSAMRGMDEDNKQLLMKTAKALAVVPQK